MKNLLSTFALTAITISTLALPIRSQTLNADERRIVDFIDKNSEQAIALIEKTVNIASPTEDLTGVRNVGMALSRELAAIGLTTKWIDMPAAQKRGGHLLAENTGNKGKRILLLGHLDTVLKGEPYRRSGNTVYGNVGFAWGRHL